MAVKTFEIDGVELYVRTKGLGQAKARLIVRTRPGKYDMNSYLYLVYRHGTKIKEHYIAKLTDEKI